MASRSELIRLSRILGMLGSAHEGERAAAAVAADRIIREMGTTWDVLLDPNRPSGESVVVRRWVDIFHDPAAAAESRMRQLRRENADLRKETARLRRLLDARNQRIRPREDGG